MERRPVMGGRRLRVGLMGLGRIGALVASELRAAPDMDLCWAVRRQPATDDPADQAAPVVCAEAELNAAFVRAHPVDVVIDFSSACAVRHYPMLAREGCRIVSAISRYEPEQQQVLDEACGLTAILQSPNITLGINFVLVASRLMQRLAPYADVEVVEEHFRDKPETSGTALKLASALGLDPATQVNSIRVGGIVGRHEVIFGLPNQTIRLIHESISGKAFGQGAMFAARWLAQQPTGRYTMEEAVRATFAATLADDLAAQPAEHVTELI
ncbi:dihydrodipicolinate reductase C-terminal domain-containing protein [Aquabacterium sp. A3]|uniref:4-hydroxy-tetrahydrodipicolinate reductase n=1 Tax=Aquabacterium sp. A3 TaxID=3132829 RepID=UPI003119A38D